MRKTSGFLYQAASVSHQSLAHFQQKTFFKQYLTHLIGETFSELVDVSCRQKTFYKLADTTHQAVGIAFG